MRYFRVKVGYQDNEFISIDETELEGALRAFLEDSKAVFANGVARGKDIIAITEDWQREMGWNTNHKLDADDWNEIKDKGVDQKYKGVIAEVRQKLLAVDNSHDRLQLAG